MNGSKTKPTNLGNLFGNVMNPSALELNAVVMVVAGFFVTAAGLFSTMM